MSIFSLLSFSLFRDTAKSHLQGLKLHFIAILVVRPSTSLHIELAGSFLERK